MVRNRRRILALLLVAVAVLTGLVLFELLQTVVFAITVAYVLYPLRQGLVRRGLSNRAASAVSTLIAFLTVVLLIVPVLYVLYQQRTQFIAILSRLPDSVPITVMGFELVIEAAPLIDAAQASLRSVAIDIAAAAPGLVLGFAVFTFLVYGILYRPNAVQSATFRAIPPAYHDIPTRLHRRTRATLYSIYVIQAATAVGTFVISLVLFWVLGYNSPFLLAVIAGILQFIPILGPSLLIVVLAASDFLMGASTRATAVLLLGLFFVSFVPDAVIRTQLAVRTGKISSGLYFVGFVGGILTVGAIGLIVGPLVVSLLIEVIEMLAEDGKSRPPTS